MLKLLTILLNEGQIDKKIIQWATFCVVYFVSCFLNALHSANSFPLWVFLG